MNKIPRFMKEYASFKQRQISEAAGSNEAARHDAVDEAVNYYYRRGLLTLDDTMVAIATVMED